MREEVLELIRQIRPFDEAEREHKEDAVRWINSGVEIFRIAKPDVPPKHLVAYFVLIDRARGKVLLVDHIKAGLWLPAGGHVELNENPKDTVGREIQEELKTGADFISEKPFFITQAVTVNLNAGHTDVSLWYVLSGSAEVAIDYDPRELKGYKWFAYEELLDTPIAKLDPHLHRFLNKWIEHGESRQ
jgi:8-oxo-dGTP diphosphatase